MRAIALALLLLMACGSPGDVPLRASSPPDAAPPDTAAADAGQDAQMEVRVGDEFDIVLPSNPSTGYQWRVVEPLDPRLRFVRRTYLPDRPVRPGSGGNDRMSFAGVAPGETVLRLRYARGDQGSAARTAEFRVRVYPGAL
ncbi:MAG TPA: protease inhibitor I42 family protein [Longimicrobium sp.]|nr:protease inhibitor I42 family protein [Longimicrobium sp.]